MNRRQSGVGQTTTEGRRAEAIHHFRCSCRFLRISSRAQAQAQSCGVGPNLESSRATFRPQIQNLASVPLTPPSTTVLFSPSLLLPDFLGHVAVSLRQSVTCLWARRGRCLHEVTMSPLPLGSVRGTANCFSIALFSPAACQRVSNLVGPVCFPRMAALQPLHTLNESSARVATFTVRPCGGRVVRYTHTSKKDQRAVDHTSLRPGRGEQPAGRQCCNVIDQQQSAPTHCQGCLLE